MYSTVKVQAFSRQHECHHIGPGHHRFPWAGVGHRRLPLHPCHPTDARPPSHPMRWRCRSKLIMIHYYGVL